MRTGKASKTALGVARLFFIANRNARHARIAPAEAALLTRRLLEAVSPSFRRLARLGDRRWMQRIVCSAESALMPGSFRHMVLRRRAVYDAVETALSAEAVQVVVLGAGFDVLALLLGPGHGDVSFFEVDHPDTQAQKRQGLEAMGVRLPNHHLVPIDFSSETLAALEGHERYRRGAPSVWVAEGLLMYLDAAEVATVLCTFREQTRPGSRMVFTYLQSLELSGWLGRILERRLRASGEPFRWAVPRAQLGAFVAEVGLSLVDAPSAEQLGARYGSDGPTASVGGISERIGVVENRRAPPGA